MNNEMKDKVRPIYSELQGYLSQAPVIKESYDTTDDKSLWQQFNNTIDELNSITGKDYSKFRIIPLHEQSDYIRISEYRTKVSGLISRLHGEYFADEIAPFSGSPATVITQNQTQQQSMHLIMLLEIQSKIDEKLNKNEVEGKGRDFLQTLKSTLSTIKDTTQLIQLILSTAKSFGITIEQLSKIFS